MKPTETTTPTANPSFAIPMSPQMLDIGLGMGQDILNKQRDKWMPGVSGFWNSLKIYFAVNNAFVLKKIVTVLYPYSNKSYFRIPADETESVSHKWALPREDMNAPDLYVPLMAFITYLLLYGLVRGITGSPFSPDYLIQALWRCSILQAVEVLAMRFGLGMMQVSLPFLDLVSYTGYKYVGLCFVTVLKLLGITAKSLSALYVSFMLAVFILGSIRCVVPQCDNGPVPRHIMLLSFAGVQFVVTLGLGVFF